MNGHKSHRHVKKKISIKEVGSNDELDGWARKKREFMGWMRKRRRLSAGINSPAQELIWTTDMHTYIMRHYTWATVEITVPRRLSVYRNGIIVILEPDCEWEWYCAVRVNGSGGDRYRLRATKFAASVKMKNKFYKLSSLCNVISDGRNLIGFPILSNA